jgi:DNA-binding PadR family transcriptional regulator
MDIRGHLDLLLLSVLGEAGLVVSRWDETASRRRRVYQLTDEGRRAQAAKKREWRGFVVGVQAVIGPMSAAGVA